MQKRQGAGNGVQIEQERVPDLRHSDRRAVQASPGGRTSERCIDRMGIASSRRPLLEGATRYIDGSGSKATGEGTSAL